MNAYVEPVVSLDLDIAVATADLPRIRTLLEQRFRVDPADIARLLEWRPELRAGVPAELLARLI